jgi:predicted secreted protein
VDREKVRKLTQRLGDSRTKKVVFLSHCILNENTRYLGGAGRGACVREIMEQCLAADIGMVQTPCPEQLAWGGVSKRLLLRAYGAKGTLPFRFRQMLLPLVIAYTRFVYRRIAKQAAKQIEDYLDSGYTVVGVVGVDGSPSCGVGKTLDLRGSFDSITEIEVESLTAHKMNDIVRRNLKDGGGLFTSALKEELEGRGIAVPFLAHDLIAELDGKKSNVDLSCARFGQSNLPADREPS